MSHPSGYLAIDLGAESGHATLGTLDGGRLSLTEVHRFPNIPVRTLDGLHWDVLRLWAEIGRASPGPSWRAHQASPAWESTPGG